MAALGRRIFVSRQYYAESSADHSKVMSVSYLLCILCRKLRRPRAAILQGLIRPIHLRETARDSGSVPGGSWSCETHGNH